MRVISLLAVSILAASASATSTVDHSSIANSNAKIEFSRRIFAAQQQPNRVLRRYDDEKEDRGIEKLDDVVERADDVLAKVTHTSPKVKNSAWVTRYPEVLEPSAVAQLVKVEEQRMKDVALLKQMNKKKPDGLQRPIESFPGMKTAPVKESHVGRDQQRYAEDGSRLLSCVVVSRPPKQGSGDVLLISSSNPNKQEWLLPKGGWDEGESIHKAAWREAIEEGGVNGAFTASLGELKFKNGEGKPYIYHAFKMNAVTVYDQWAESMRYRIWVSYDDAIKLLGNRKEMIDIVNRARAAAAA